MNILKRIRFYKKKYTGWYRQDYKKFIALNNGNNEFELNDNFPCVKDKFLQSGEAGSAGHYFFQDIYVAQEIYRNNPEKHVDIGSRIDGFIAHVSVFREIEVFDIRPQTGNMKNVVFKQADLTLVDKKYENYCDSISCLHTIEHFGLGRYGDNIDPSGHIKGFSAIGKILKSNGIFYFSVPMGPNRIEFNAHRIFSAEYLINWVSAEYIIEKFTYIDDNNQLHENAELNNDGIKNNFGCNHGCAIFVLRKK